MIIVTGNGNLAKELVNLSTDSLPIISLSKKDMDITDESKVHEVIKNHMNASNYPKYIIHTAALTKPMEINDLNPIESVSVNIVGTANVARVCHKYNIKFIYISTDFVYNTETDYEEDFMDEKSSLNPPNNYGWSKLGGECVTKLISNSLILRCALCDIPFRHKVAFDDVFRNSITHKDVAKIILKLKDEVGVINLGGEYQSVYDFISKYQEIKKGHSDGKVPSVYLSIDKLSKILEKCL